MHWKFKNEEQAKKLADSTDVEWIIMKDADKKFVRDNIMEAIRE